VQKKDIIEEACWQIASFFYTSAIPFNCVKNPEFLKALELVAKHGPSFKPPYYHDIREKYLKQEVDQTILVLLLVMTLINPLDVNDIDVCLRNNEEDEGNEAGFNLHDTSAYCLF